jgi:RNA polymerase sigma-70 factor, ECF subfamily
MRIVTVPIVRESYSDAYWDELYERARPVLYRTAAFLLPAEEAEEVVQESFERALRTTTFRTSTREPVAWLRTAVGRIALDRLRRKQVWERVRALLVPEAVTNESASEIRDALRRLPPRQRVALVLRYYQEASYVDIAEALTIQADSVGPLLTRAKAALRDALR